MKNKKHNKIIDDYYTFKSKHLEKLGVKILKADEKFRKLRDKKINDNFLKNF